MAKSKPTFYLWLLAQRRKRRTFPQLSQIRVHPTQAAFTVPLKFDPNEIKIVYLRCMGGEVGAKSALAPKIVALGLSPKEVCDDITKATSEEGAENHRETDHSEPTCLNDVVPSASALIVNVLNHHETVRSKKTKQNKKTH